MQIRRAKLIEDEILTEISFKSKAYWNYPVHYYDIWRDELTIKREYISQNQVFVAEENAETLGYYSLVNLQEDIEVGGIPLEKGVWLEHMFILPQFLLQGIGSQMIDHLKNQLSASRISHIRVLADPHSKGFYLKMGFTYVKDYPSTIVGRTTPLLDLHV